MSDQQITPGNGHDEASEQPSEDGDTPILRYLRSPEGTQLLQQLLQLIDAFRTSTLDANANARKAELDQQRLELEHRQSRDQKQFELSKLLVSRTWWFQTIGLVVVVGAIVGLSLAAQLDPAAGTILGAVAGYLFGQRRDNERES